MDRFYDRKTQYTNRYKIKQINESTVELTKDEGTIAQIGTKLNAENLNKIVDELNGLAQSLANTNEELSGKMSSSKGSSNNPFESLFFGSVISNSNGICIPLGNGYKMQLGKVRVPISNATDSEVSITFPEAFVTEDIYMNTNIQLAVRYWASSGFNDSLSTAKIRVYATDGKAITSNFTVAYIAIGR